jgi:hypothetical protein
MHQVDKSIGDVLEKKRPGLKHRIHEARRHGGHMQNRDLDIVSENISLQSVYPEMSREVRTNFFLVRNLRSSLAQVRVCVSSRLKMLYIF